ncbi:imidazolonepropionase [Conexibacter sp. JD483]|uniref:imidazolonepropionase n=1 Tax=unclassified Conexibacter TaxID=2627773 RepID=UPI002715702E|nr:MULTISPECIES: imidazolonepropionase [unclassified Conexibacter]MDO8189112.1 imidazolonepropionase [Conexibacter sp. CPCC 205706]MDO8200840.1 imidazolonepropionase [Conexibacter sp. CPCC 205762]MDR9371727.1 imidazolonepropionase [Conexibacter sp. JD483]
MSVPISTSIEGAAQLLRPPQDGLPYLRLDRAGELRAEPGSLTLGDDGRIAALEASRGAAQRIDARGCAVVPGFVDCHTHLPFAGWRADEYALKVAGRPYEEIARAGGGIRSSARALAEADDEQVLAQAGGLAAEMLAHGTTTFETKSGYGLSIDAETRALRLAGALAGRVAQEVCSTALVAHAVPDGFDADGWLDAIEAALPAMLGATGVQTSGAAGEAAPLATRVQALDVYVESVAFTNAHLERVGALAAEHGLDLRAHVEQFAQHRSVPVALRAGARSVDHLACLHPDDLRALAAAECAAVLLPGAEFLGEEPLAPGRALADAGAIAVLATDANPGTSPIVSLPLAIGLAVRRYRWTPREALLAATLNAAWVLRRSHETGSLEVGKRADVLVLDGPIESVPYRFGHNPVAFAFAGGRLVHVRPDCAWRLSA